MFQAKRLIAVGGQKQDCSRNLLGFLVIEYAQRPFFYPGFGFFIEGRVGGGAWSTRSSGCDTVALVGFLSEDLVAASGRATTFGGRVLSHDNGGRRGAMVARVQMEFSPLPLGMIS